MRDAGLGIIAALVAWALDSDSSALTTVAAVVGASYIGDGSAQICDETAKTTECGIVNIRRNWKRFVSVLNVLSCKLVEQQFFNSRSASKDYVWNEYLS